MNKVVNFIHIERPYNFYILLYDIHSSFNVPAISYRPDILLILFLARDKRVIYFNGGKLTILSMQFDDIDNFYTLAKLLKTLVYNLSIGGVLIRTKVPRRQA